MTRYSQRPEAWDRLTREREREDWIVATPPEPTGGPFPLRGPLPEWVRRAQARRLPAKEMGR
jgi:hypothetical protein